MKKNELIRKVAKPLGISGALLDRIPFKHYDKLLQELKGRKS